MNKLVEAKQLQTTTAPPTVPAVPPEYQAELDRFRQAALENIKPTLLGQVLRFKKGEWLLGGEKQKIAAGTRFLAIMNEARHGWLKWNDDKSATHIVGKVVEGFVAPSRDQLDCRDETCWPIGLNGQHEDPWRKVVYLPLLSLDGEIVVTFSTTTRTGVPVFWKLIDRHAWVGRKHPGEYPIVEIQSGGYEDKRFGFIDTPAFKITGYVGKPDLQKLIGNGDGVEEDDATTKAADGMSDEIPF